MSNDIPRAPVLSELYQQYLVDHDAPAYMHRVSQRYFITTTERLATAEDRLVRRGAVLALGGLADYTSNAVLGRALNDRDRGVRLLAENGIRGLWCRVGTAAQRQRLTGIIRLNTSKHYAAALEAASVLIQESPWLAEAWNQRAIAHYCLEHYDESILDCREALEINPYHFGAAAGMGQCYLKLGERTIALTTFRRALGLNPELEGIRANVRYLERSLKEQQ